MKKTIFALIMVTALLYGVCREVYSQPVTIQRVQLNANNISTYFQNTGIFNQNTSVPQGTAGFEWPKNSGKYAIFSTGFTIAGYIGGQYAMTAASYKGEYSPGYSLGGIYYTDASFKIYKVTRGDNAITNPDYANWGLMVPYGAPYKDMNNNGIYDQDIDTPGVKNAAQTIFMALTDANVAQHTSGEGFGGGVTLPLLHSDLRLTAWCYSQTLFEDMQFVKMVIINKNSLPWNNVYTGIVCDPDIGDANDDYIGCDQTLQLGYCYNADNYDNVYGTSPPAVGMILLKGINNPVNLGMTSFNFFTPNGENPPPCESDPNGEPLPAYYMLKGLKKDQSPFMDASFTTPVATKFNYYGNPMTNIGWTEYKGKIDNCGGTTGNYTVPVAPGNRRFIIGTGAENLTIMPNETQTIYLCQLIARETGKNSPESNLSSVTKLKQIAANAWDLYNSNFTIGINNVNSEIPEKFSLYQNYPNPFNPVTKIRFDVVKPGNVLLKVYDIQGKEIATLVNEKLSPGTYETNWDGSVFSSGVYFYKITDGEYTETKMMTLIK